MLKGESFGDFLKSYRQERGMSTHDIHSETGVSQPYLSQIENGKKPSIKIIKRISDGLGLNYHYLMRLAGYITEKDIDNLYKKLESREKELKSLLSRYKAKNDELLYLKSNLHKYMKESNDTTKLQEISQLIAFTEHELKSLKVVIEELKHEIIGITMQLDSSLNGLEEKQTKEIISDLLEFSNTSVDLLEVLSSEISITFGNRTLTNLEKKQILSVIKALLDN
ncbi:helix-turn-helix domain-containing protein [Solibacillus sp. FSL R7-0682]|uniref:helix-turn-helix domain-containing protein n=1 Tax=Solibacillus sp. FSL R7-0682 TaxID=2921690 RepID=UPI0030F56615